MPAVAFHHLHCWWQTCSGGLVFHITNPPANWSMSSHGGHCLYGCPPCLFLHISSAGRRVLLLSLWQRPSWLSAPHLGRNQCTVQKSTTNYFRRRLKITSHFQNCLFSSPDVYLKLNHCFCHYYYNNNNNDYVVFFFQDPSAFKIDISWWNWTPRKHIFKFALFKIFFSIHSHTRATFMLIYLREYMYVRTNDWHIIVH